MKCEREVKNMARGNYPSDPSIDEKVLMAIVRVGEYFKRESSAIFRNYGLTFSQYNVLRALYASDNEQNSISTISKIMLVSGANMTGIAKRLEKNGFVIRKRDPQDERITLLEITPKGMQTLKNIQEPKDHFIDEILSDFTDEDRRLFLSKTGQILKRDAIP
ncbi:MAG: MarR family winged helix-turn-helix transcriptional regulator [Desulfatiglandales bacterium]